MHAAAQLWRGVTRALEWFTVALLASLFLCVLWGVISRYVPGIRPSSWTEELSVYLLVWVSLIGATLTYRGYGHLGVDYFVSKLDPSAQRVVAVIVELVVLIFAGFALGYGGFRLVADTLAAGQLTPVLQWRIGYLYAAVPLSGVFMCAFAIEHLLRLRLPPE
jgi:TRAP-type C4-dicarboxylate transport system permease small subunit